MTTSPGPRTEPPFDIREFTRTAQGSFRAELALAEFGETPLPASELEFLRYLSRLESATMEHLRNLLVTATHKDARVTAFLVTWAFEKFWMADALDAVLQAHDLPRTRDVPEGPPRKSADEAIQRSGPVRRAVAAIGLGTPIVAVHVLVGLVDEWILEAAYDQLRTTTRSSALRDTIDRITTIKKRHEAFFADETDWRLRDSKAAVRRARAALLTAAWPVGGVERAAADRTMFEEFVFGGPDGAARAEAIGARVAALPGLDARMGTITAKKLVP